jgi:hypothetical protein
MFLATVITTQIGHFIWLSLSGLVIGGAVWKNAKSADNTLANIKNDARRRNSHRRLL